MRLLVRGIITNSSHEGYIGFQSLACKKKSLTENKVQKLHISFESRIKGLSTCLPHPSVLLLIYASHLQIKVIVIHYILTELFCNF